MAESKVNVDICICGTPKTVKYIEEHNNKCSQCGKMLIELEIKVLEQLMKGNTPFNAPSQNSGVRLKPPTLMGN